MHEDCRALLKERSQFVDAVQPLPVSAKKDSEGGVYIKLHAA